MLTRHVIEITAVALTGLAADMLTSDAVLFEVRPEVSTRKTYELATSSVVEEAVLDLGGMGEHNPGEGMTRKGLSTFEVEDEPVDYGLTRNIHTFNPLRIAFHEWRTMYREAARAGSLGEALGAIFAAPGWSADGSTLTAHQLQCSSRRRPAL